MKKYLIPLLIMISLTCLMMGCSSSTSYSNGEVVVYNWGEYINPEVIDLFEEEYDIKVIYEEFETNEIMYPKIEAGASSYDVICPSDYMIKKMIDNDLLAPLNLENIPNASNIGDLYYQQSQTFDPNNTYSIPYCWGTVGILYNKTLVKEKVDSWDILWNPAYKDSILMQDSVRDAYAIALKRAGHSLNTTDKTIIEKATQDLMSQKELVQAYVIDQARDKMIGEEAALAVIYSGEALFTKRENDNLEYVIPKEGSNLWIDSWVIPKNSQNMENAEKWINFMCRPDIALMNFEYTTYSTPNMAAKELIEDERMKNSPILFPDEESLVNCETYLYLGEEMDEYYGGAWNKVKSN